MFTSKFRFYSIGIAATNKKRKSMEIEVCPIEVLNLIDGEVVPNAVDFLSKGIDGEENEYTVSVTGANTVTATWLQLGSNRVTAPDVRRGEHLLLFRYADSDIFYWVSLGKDDDLRRLETVVYAFSNTRDESVRELTPDNSYYFEVSTHDKHITLKTNKSDGEPFAYTIQLNTKEGRLTLMDDVGNSIYLDSADRQIKHQNADGTMVDLNKKNLNMKAPQLINMECEGWNVKASKYISFKTKKWDVVSANSITYTTQSFQGNITASVFTGTVGVSGLLTAGGGFAMASGIEAVPTISGDAESGLSMSVNFALTGAAAASIAGSLTAADIHATASLKHMNVDVGKDHDHANPEGGNTGTVNP